MTGTLDGGDRTGGVVDELSCDLWKHYCQRASQRLWNIGERDETGRLHSAPVILVVAVDRGRIRDSQDGVSLFNDVVPDLSARRPLGRAPAPGRSRTSDS